LFKLVLNKLKDYINSYCHFLCEGCQNVTLCSPKETTHKNNVPTIAALDCHPNPNPMTKIGAVPTIGHVYLFQIRKYLHGDLLV